jgi:ADP-ribose pyrophosphatase YjhB (NUDIX family)
MNEQEELEQIVIEAELVIAGLHGQTFSIVLVLRDDGQGRPSWGLPRQEMQVGVPLDVTARQEVERLTGANPTMLEQVYLFDVWGQPQQKRILRMVYFALIGTEQVQEVLSEAKRWFPALGPLPLTPTDTQRLHIALNHLHSHLDQNVTAIEHLRRRQMLTHPGVHAMNS